MQEPGITDPDFDRLTTDRNKPGRRAPAPMKLPGEYAEFRLKDGRYLGEVLGESFFGPESGSDGGESLPANPLDQMPKGGSVFGGVFEGNPRFSRGPVSAKRTLDRGNALISGASKGAPEGIGAPFRPAMPDDDNEAGFTNLSFGPEEGNIAAGSSVSGQRPGGGRIENSGRRLEEAEKPEFTSADILDPRDRQEFENLEIAMQSAERKIALHEDRLDLFERRFKNKRIDARAMGRARRYFDFRIGQQEALIERNERRLTEIRAEALLDAAALSPGDTPRAEDTRDDEGFWTFGLPLTAEGQVDESALRPGAVSRIPDSAGGGTGQLKNGAFYNFDQKGDWRFRTSADLDAYSGVSDAPTPEEREGELDKAIMPAARLDEGAIEAFTKKSGYGLARADGGYTLTTPSGGKLFDLAEEDAAELARIWSPEIAGRVATIGLIWRDDLTSSEKRDLLAKAVYAGETLAGRILSGPEYRAHIAKSAERNLARKRLQAYDALAGAMARGAADEEIGELLGEFNAAMLPEVLGTERFVRELLMDLAPGLGNVRSFRHLQNDIAEIDRAIETGEWGDAAWASGMAVLDFVGLFPGGNLLKAGIKQTGRGLVKAVPRLDGLLAERTIRRFIAQWGKKVGKVKPERFVGELFSQLDPKVRKQFAGLVNDRVGEVSEIELFDLGKRMDGNAAREVGKEVPDGFQIKTRIYDMEATFLSDIIAAKNATLGRLARWIVNAGDGVAAGTKAERKQLELKTGEKQVPSREGDVDKHFNEHPDDATDYDVSEVIYLRKSPEEVSINFVIHDLSQYLDDWVAERRINVSVAAALKNAMARMKAKGTTTIKLVEYIDVLARLGAATGRRIETEIDEDPTAISPYQP